MKIDRITIEPGKMGGKACVRGMRITVSFVLKMLAAGMTRDEIIGDHPDLEPQDIDQCLEYASLLADDQYFSLPVLSS
jgi:uncharacterized protein (DUF433 family)